MGGGWEVVAEKVVRRVGVKVKRKDSIEDMQRGAALNQIDT